MSRIYVKNLPKYVAEDRLKEFFSQKGEITDAKLMRTKDGKSRQFAFIGFRTEREAEEAINYFNKSFLDTSRITCEIARKVGDPNTPRPWSRHSRKKEEEGTKGGKTIVGSKDSGLKGAKDDKKNSKKGNENDDAQFKEFLEVMQPRVNTKMWANDTLVASKHGQDVGVSPKEAPMDKESRKKSVPELVHLNKSDDHATETSENPAQDEVISDMDYFKSRVKKDWSDSESENSEKVGSSDDDDDDEDDNDEDKDGNEYSDFPRKSFKNKDARVVYEDGQGDAPIKDVTHLANLEEVPSENSDGEILDPDNPSLKLEHEKHEVLETTRLFVRNLPYTATEDELEEHFSKFGNVLQVHILVDKDTKRSKGLAYISYSLPDSAARALEELDNSIFQGRLLHVMPAKQKITSDKQETEAQPNQGSKTLKQRRQEEKKAAEASGDTRAWNSLFMRPDTVVEYVARRKGVSKSDLLDGEADDLAVRVALVETQVISETKRAFISAGINFSSLEEFATGKTENIKRSNYVILVKNLPYSSSEGDLAKMFGKFGSLDKVILPPTKALALVIFLEPSEARAAFRGLAYKRYKDGPLYLEWAPANILSPSSALKGDDQTTATVGNDDVKRVMLEQNVEGISTDIDPDRIESRSLFVKNLNFKTSDASLKKHFSEHVKEGKILSVRIKKHLKKGQNLSMGFGFIEFDSVDTATNVCRDLQGTVLDGHALILQLCHAKKDEQMKKVEKDKSSTKLLVRNVAFEATEKDLRQLFSPFGQIKSLRLPTRIGNHRGFAFVEYVTKQEAQNALEALSNTHLYGRHLVLERAKEGESLEELRAKTAAQFAEGQNPTKLTKKRKQTDILDEESMKFQRITD